MGTTARLPALSSKQVIKLLEGQGFTAIRQKGSHIRFRKEEAGRLLLVTVPSNQKEIPKGTLNGILSQAGLSKEMASMILV